MKNGKTLNFILKNSQKLGLDWQNTEPEPESSLAKTPRAQALNRAQPGS